MAVVYFLQGIDIRRFNNVCQSFQHDVLKGDSIFSKLHKVTRKRNDSSTLPYSSLVTIFSLFVNKNINQVA